MEKIDSKSNDKQSFYGFRKAFIKDFEISMEARFLLILLLTYKGKNSTCWPSIGELSKRMGKNKDTVRKYLRELEAKGYLKTRSRGIGRSHLYTPSYWKISAGQTTHTQKNEKPAEETICQPAESTLNRSISSGNKDNGFKTGKDLFDKKRKELELL